ncbi:MAG: AsmA family protein [Candidatus Margulisiibacteriota bacterium]
MLKKTLKWAGIAAGGLLLLLVIGIVALPFVFPLEKIKDFAVAKISETIHREVKIDKVSFDLFSGIKLQGLYVGNRPGFAKQPFVTADAIELRYAFWPLFSRQVIIKEIALVKPQILVEKNARGEFNFSDMVAGNGKPAAKQPDKPAAKPPFDLFVSSFSIKNAKLTYADRAAGTVNEVKNFNLKVGGFELALVKPIDLAASAVATYQGKEIPLSLGGQIGVSLASETINVKNLTLSIAGESLSAGAAVSGWRKAPRLNATISSQKFNVDPLLAIFAGAAKTPSAKPKPGELTKMVNGLTAAIPRNVSANVNLDVANLTFQKFKVDKIDASLGLANKVATVKLKGVKIYEGLLSGNLQANLNTPGLAYEVKDLRLSGFNASPFSNAVVETFLTGMPDSKDLVNKVYGTLDISTSLTGRGVEPDAIMSNLNLHGSLVLKNGELKRLKTLAEIGKTLKSTSLQQDLKFGALYTAFSFANRVVTAKALKVEEADFKLYFNGGADLKSLKWVPGNKLTLKLAPHLTKDLPREYSIFKDAKGWFELSFEMTGDLKKPFPKPILDKPLEVLTEKVKAKIEAKKVEIVESAKTEVATKAAEVKKELEEKAKGAIKDLLKF